MIQTTAYFSETSKSLLTARTIERAILIQRRRITCTSSSESTNPCSVATESGVVSLVGEDTRGSLAANGNYHTIEDVNRITGDNLCTPSTQCHVGHEIDGAVAPGGIQLQRRICGQHAIADGKHAIISERSHFDDVGVRIDVICFTRASERNLSTVPAMTNIDRAAVGHDFSVYVCRTIRTGSQNCDFPTWSRGSTIEQGE